jgi:aminomethyltransferase
MTTISRRAQAQYAAVSSPGGAGITKRPVRSLLQVTGDDRLAFLQGMLSNDLLSLKPGEGCRAAALNSTGHILADIEVHIAQSFVLLETDPRCASRLRETLERYVIMEDVEIADISTDWRKITLVGDGARAMLDRAFPAVGGQALALRSGTYLGDGPGFARAMHHAPVPAFDLWLPADLSGAAVRGLIAAGADPFGRQVSEILRVEAGIAAWGSELDESVLLPEANIGEAVSYSKGCYVGQEIVARIRSRGHTNRILKGLLFAAGAEAPAAGAVLHLPEGGSDPGREVGRVTSVVYSPRLGGPVGLAYLRRELSAAGSRVAADLSGGMRTHASVADLPFAV